MARLNLELRKRVIVPYFKGYTVREICRRLREVYIFISLRAIYNLLRKYREKHILIDIRDHGL